MRSLTSKQKRVLDFISSYLSQKDQSPTIEEIRSSLGFKSSRSVIQYLDALAEKGYIARTGDARSIRLVEYEMEKIGNETELIPLYGIASCGTPEFYADDNVQDYVAVDKKLLRGKREDYYLVRASGTSMNKEIGDSELVLLEKKDSYDEKESILAIVDGMAVIKKLYKGKSAVLLMPSSTEDGHRPIVASDDLYIAGRVACTIPDPTDTSDLIYVGEDGRSVRGGQLFS